MYYLKNLRVALDENFTYLLVLMSTVSFSVFAAENIEQGKDQQLLTSCHALAISSEQAAAQTINSSFKNKQDKQLYKPCRTKG